jgi:hypothetical protein
MGFPRVAATDGNEMASDSSFGEHGGKDAEYVSANDLEMLRYLSP